MNWELVRIGIDVLSVLMAIIMIFVLYFAYKSYRKVSQPIDYAKEVLSGLMNQKPEEEEVKDDPDNVYKMELSQQV